MSYSLVIRNGTIVDGAGQTEPYDGDVAIQDGRIVDIGRVTERGLEEIDADGHVVTPGFIDGHTHMDAQIMWDPLGTCSCWHGVTTVVMGNCGFTLAPSRAEQRELTVRNIERAEDISRDTLAAGVQWRWETFPDYLDVLDQLPLGINYAAYVGHSALRSWAMGERAFEEPATESDLTLMSDQLRDALHAGAIGFSTSRSVAHLTTDSRPVASRLATWDEVCGLVRVMARTGRGIFELTPGPGATGDPNDVAEIYDRIYDLNLLSGVPFTFGLFGTGPERLQRLRDIDAVVARGGRIFTQTHSRGVSNVLSLKSRLPYDVLPEWKEIRGEPIDEQLAALRDPAVRERLVHAAKHGSYGAPVGTEPKRPNYDTMLVLENALPPNPSVRRLASERGVDPVEVIIYLILETEGDQFFFSPLHPIDDAIKVETITHPQTVMTFSDSGAHVSQIMDASIQTYLLAHWVRNEKVIPLTTAVQKMTSTPAGIWGFTDRGLVRQGYVADLNIFDPDTVAPTLPTVTADLPGGAMRLKQGSTGLLATIVAGTVLLRDGEHTGALPGQLIRSAGRH